MSSKSARYSSEPWEKQQLVFLKGFYSRANMLYLTLIQHDEIDTQRLFLKNSPLVRGFKDGSFSPWPHLTGFHVFQETQPGKVMDVLGAPNRFFSAQSSVNFDVQ
jgi:hypothetical protein